MVERVTPADLEAAAVDERPWIVRLWNVAIAAGWDSEGGTDGALSFLEAPAPVDYGAVALPLADWSERELRTEIARRNADEREPLTAMFLLPPEEDDPLALKAVARRVRGGNFGKRYGGLGERRGGTHRRMQKLTPEERSEHGRRSAEARWGRGVESPLTRRIVRALLDESPLTTPQVVARCAPGADERAYKQVSWLLARLCRERRIQRVRHGVYAATPDSAPSDVPAPTAPDDAPPVPRAARV